MSDTTSTSETFLRNHPRLTRTLSSTSSKLKAKYSKYKPTVDKYLLNFNNFFQNKYVKAVLYIILILYASVIAPKLPNWIIPYLEYSIVKIVIVFIIGVLATQDPIAAIIATIGVTITYLFISENKVTNYIKNMFDNNENENEEENEEENKKKETFVQSRQTSQSHQTYQQQQPTMNIEHFNTKNETTNHNVEYFDVLNNNHSYINHVEEHFDILNNEQNKNEPEKEMIFAYDNQNYANNANINY
jgi:hypothetical protein